MSVFACHARQILAHYDRESKEVQAYRETCEALTKRLDAAVEMLEQRTKGTVDTMLSVVNTFYDPARKIPA